MAAHTTKASILELLRSRLEYSVIDDYFVFTVDDWKAAPQILIDKISSIFRDEIIIRSSALDEDQLGSSSSGKYLSVQNVDPADHRIIIDGINEVIFSYERKGNFAPDNEILVQKQVTNPLFSGVVMTRDPKTNSPYYIIEYDESGKTDTVTGFGKRKKRVIFKSDSRITKEDRKFNNLLTSVKEIERVLKNENLIIEFAVTNDFAVHIFQAKSINSIVSVHPDLSYEKYLRELQIAIKSSGEENDIFSNMSDWNPAEMLGAFPSAFSASLYAVMITDDAWAKARANLGYRLTDHHLMTVIAGRPYIKVKYSLFSLLPSELRATVAERIVSQQLISLAHEHTLHDKLEFKIAISKEVFSAEELSAVLNKHYGIDLTGDIVLVWKAFNAQLIKLSSIKINEVPSVIEQLEYLKQNVLIGADSAYPKSLETALQELKFAGVIPFAEMARIAFFGKSFLDWLHDMHLLSASDYLDFYADIGSLPYQGENSRLRSSTYDILSVPYAITELEMNLSLKLRGQPLVADQLLSNTITKQAIEQFLNDCGNPLSDSEFLTLIRNAIHYRELIKFHFTQVLSAIIESYATWGVGCGIGRNEISMFTIAELNHYPVSTLKEMIISKQSEREFLRGILLPPVIDLKTNFCDFEVQQAKPNFITTSVVTAKPAYIDAQTDRSVCDLGGKIVVIEAADPGFDWIFLQPIKGLVTKYGGMASHMSIRCYEYRICAAIGCGEVLFEGLSDANEIVIDAGKEVIFKR